MFLPLLELPIPVKSRSISQKVEAGEIDEQWWYPGSPKAEDNDNTKIRLEHNRN
jgi:hypothetical protein